MHFSYLPIIYLWHRVRLIFSKQRIAGGDLFKSRSGELKLFTIPFLIQYIRFFSMEREAEKTLFFSALLLQAGGL